MLVVSIDQYFFNFQIASTMLAYLFVLESLGASKIDDELASNSTEEEGHH